MTNIGKAFRESTTRIGTIYSRELLTIKVTPKPVSFCPAPIAAPGTSKPPGRGLEPQDLAIGGFKS
jgi:hypothetical protein